jgi:hypothetical protein
MPDDSTQNSTSENSLEQTQKDFNEELDAIYLEYIEKLDSIKAKYTQNVGTIVERGKSQNG